MKFIDLFAGIGGFHYGIEKAKEAECVYSNEWDKYANSVYRAHFGECDNRDIRTVDANSLPDFDLLCAGFPCQSFSIVGKRGGFTDTRGTLFFEIARIARAKRPHYLFLENVKGLLSHDEGNTFATIINTIDELGYDCQWQVLNSKNFGVPQNRERVFIIGYLRGTGRPQVFPIERNNGETAFGPVTTSAGRNRSTGSNYVNEVQSGKINMGKFEPTNDEALSLDANYWKGMDNHGQRTMIKYGNSQDMKISQDLSQTLSAGHFNQPKIAVGQAMRVNSIDKPSVTLKGLGGGMGAKTGLYETEDMKIRRLTPIEYERLQGFPDNWTKYGADGELISDTQRYKQCGNAVTTNVITAIATEL